MQLGERRLRMSESLTRDSLAPGVERGRAPLVMTRHSRRRSQLFDVESLRVFRELVARGGFTAAAKALGISQPTVSQTIRRLEERLGMSLVVRDGYSVILTAHGRDLLAHAEEILEAYDRAVDHMRRSELRGALRLGSSAVIAASGLAAVVGRFRRTHPDIDLAIRVDMSPTISEMLDDGEIDVALLNVVDVGDAVRPTDVVWRREQLQVVQGLGADLDGADPVPLITSGVRGLLDRHLVSVVTAAGYDYRISAEWPSIKGVLDAIEAGLGVGIVPASHVTDGMRPWRGGESVDLPRLALVLRTRADADGNELISALEQQLEEMLAPARL